MNILDLPVNFPSYQNLEVGDVFVWFVGDDRLETKEGNPLIHAHWYTVKHAHWYTVKHKGKRFAEIEIELLQCDNFGHKPCTEGDERQTFGWSKVQFYSHKTRWMKGKAALVLFGKRIYGNEKA